MLGKSLTGVEGLDTITSGGLPRGRSTLISGGPGSGKTVLTLRSLVHDAVQSGDQPDLDLVLSGGFDFGGLLAMLKAKGK